MQCNSSDGSRLPGSWDNIAATPVRLPLPPPARNCVELSLEREILDQMWTFYFKILIIRLFNEYFKEISNK